ncbi:MAG TPA: hypothetical protein VJU84_16055 [Pyrinomonadaceae bacterium]|nr:hypothetical protein [Pyrinomonadaceae bacterium]
MPLVSHTWGTTSEERRYQFPCDRLIPHPDDSLFRGVTINAPADVVFRWLCQLRVAPYSYDLIDNGGRQSPQQLTPGLDDLAIGQDVMTIFALADFERDRQFTIRTKPNTRTSRTFGDFACSYLIIPTSGDECRLLVKLVVKHPTSLMGKLLQPLLPWGDLIMMRRQLLNFKKLAERPNS